MSELITATIVAIPMLYFIWFQGRFANGVLAVEKDETVKWKLHAGQLEKKLEEKMLEVEETDMWKASAGTLAVINEKQADRIDELAEYINKLEKQL